MTNIEQTRFFTLTFLAASLTLPAMAQLHKPTLTEFDAPGAATVSSPACANAGCGTTAFANNAEGVVVGFYTDTNVVPHAFLRTPNGQYISFDAPGAGLGAGLDQGTVAYSINDLGVIAGQFEDSSYVYHGFVRFPMAPCVETARISASCMACWVRRRLPRSRTTRDSAIPR